MENLIRKTFYDPKHGFVSAGKIWEKLKDKGVTLKQVKEWMNKQESVQVQKEPRKTVGFNIVGSAGDWQSDLTFYEQYKGSNNGYSIILAFIEIPSRKAWATKLIRKNSEEMIKALERFVSKYEVKRLTTDNGSEFISKPVEKWLEEKE